ncbi:MAG: IclR family transcriptional regulator [Acidobacteria bacterium]|nr:IclR family transcriptional regulator [Acidobacteriota bacterium]
MAAGGSSTAVERALAILEAIAQRDGLTNSQISRKLGIPKSSASYILRTLERRGYVRRERSSGRYRIGLHVLSLSRGILRGLDIREVALPVLRHLVERSHLSAHLAMLDHGEMVYIEKVDAPGFIKMDTWVGRRMAVHSTAVGKALIAYSPEGEVEELIQEQRLKRRTPKTLTVQQRFVQELERVRSHGYAVDDEENSIGVRCVAAPLFDDQGRVLASVGVTGTTSQLHKADLPQVAELVKDAARKISQRFASHPVSHRS